MHRQCVRLGVAHRRDHRKTVPWVGHVQVSDEHVKALGSNASQSLCHASGGGYLKSFALKPFTHHGANRVIVVHHRQTRRAGSRGRAGY
jgi:hypothetical protein